MLEKLIAHVRRFEEIEKQMQSADPAQMGMLMKEYGKLQRYALIYRELEDVRRRIEDSKKLLAQENDAELRALAEEELKEFTGREVRILEKIQDMFDEESSYSDRNVIMEIRPGVGGEEAALFAGDLYRMYTRFAERKGWKIEVLDLDFTDLKGVRNAVLSIEGDNVYKFLKYEGGTHRVQRVPRTEASGRIHTSAATVAVLPQAEEVDVEIRPQDLEIVTASSGGPGGQHVNKTQSKVIITHKPTGIMVYSQADRSQHRNREIAMTLLRTKLLERKIQEQSRQIGSLRSRQIGSGDRSEKIRTYNFPQNRVTDHRIGFESHRLPEILDGDLDELVNALLEDERRKKLQAFQPGP